MMQNRTAAPAPEPASAPAGMTDSEIMAELRDIACARPGDAGGEQVKVTDRLKALDLLHKYNAETPAQAAAGTEGLTIRLEVLDGTDA